MDDQQLTALLRPFARASVPVLAVLAEGDPFGLRGRSLGAVSNIDGVDPSFLVRLGGLPDSLDGRLSRLTGLLTAVPGVDRAALSAAARGLLVCSIAAEQGAPSTEFRVRVLAGVLAGRDVDPTRADAEEDRVTAELTEALPDSLRRHGRYTVRAVAGTLWRLGRRVGTMVAEPRVPLPQRLLLRRTRAAAQQWIVANRQVQWDPRRQQ